MTELWERLCHLIIRPPRCQYELTDLGPKSFQLDDGKTYKRTDFQVVNARGHRLECSHWEPVQRVAMQLPCVIYCHGNCGSRLDAAEAVDCLLSYNITVVALDFSGCGRSEGEFVSLGAFEPDDIACLVEHLRASGTVSRLGLWGRSMGAVSALLYSVRDPTVAGMVLDSPFSNLSDLIVEIAQGFASKVPGFLLRLVGRIMRSSVRSRAGFDIECVRATQRAVRVV